MLKSSMAELAAQLGKDLIEAVDIARRSWLFSGPQGYGALWDTLTPHGKMNEMDRHDQLKKQYDAAYALLLKLAPGLVELIDTDNLDVRIKLEVALEMEGLPYSTPEQFMIPTPDAAPTIRPRQLHMRRNFLDTCPPQHPGWSHLRAVLFDEPELPGHYSAGAPDDSLVGAVGPERWTEAQEQEYRCQLCHHSVATCVCILTNNPDGEN